MLFSNGYLVLSITTDVSNFQAFFNYVDVNMMMKNFCVYHLNAPGQEEGAANFPDGCVSVSTC